MKVRTIDMVEGKKAPSLDRQLFSKKDYPFYQLFMRKPTLGATLRKAVEMKVRTIYKLGDEQRVRPTDGLKPRSSTHS
jgi:hypothetical protein